MQHSFYFDKHYHPESEKPHHLGFFPTHDDNPYRNKMRVEYPINSLIGTITEYESVVSLIA